MSDSLQWTARAGESVAPSKDHLRFVIAALILATIAIAVWLSNSMDIDASVLTDGQMYP